MSYWTLKSIAVYVLEEIKMLLDGIKRLIGGGGGNRTRVRKSSAVSSTCIAGSFEFNRGPSDRQDGTRRFPEFRNLTRDVSDH